MSTPRSRRSSDRHRRPTAASARASCGRTARSRCRASSPTRPTCRPSACCGARPCGAPTRTPASSRSTSRQALATPGVAAVLTHEDVPGAQDLRARAPRPARARVGRGALPGRGRGARGRRPPRDSAAGRRPRRGRVRGAARRRRRRAGDAARLAGAAPGRATCCATCAIRHGDADAAEADVVVQGEYEVGMQDQAFLGPESGLAVPDGEGGVDLYIATQWLHVDRDQLAASLDLPPEQRADHARGRRRGVRCARGSLDADPRLPARAAHRPAREARVRPRGVVLRARPPPPRAHAVRARRDPRRQARLRPRADRARRRRLRVELGRCRRERRLLRRRAVRLPERVDRQLRRLHRQPALRRDARLRRGADVLRLRVADGPARRRARPRPGRAAAAERDGRGLAPADRAGRGGPDARSPSCSSGCRRCRCPPIGPPTAPT